MVRTQRDLPCLACHFERDEATGPVASRAIMQRRRLHLTPPEAAHKPPASLRLAGSLVSGSRRRDGPEIPCSRPHPTGSDIGQSIGADSRLGSSTNRNPYPRTDSIRARSVTVASLRRIRWITDLTA